MIDQNIDPVPQSGRYVRSKGFKYNRYNCECTNITVISTVTSGYTTNEEKGYVSTMCSRCNRYSVYPWPEERIVWYNQKYKLAKTIVI